MFEVTVIEIIGHPEGPSKDRPIERFRQAVDVLDMRKLIDAVNYKPRVRKAKEKNGGAQ